jgi:hypothetical protein
MRLEDARILRETAIQLLIQQVAKPYAAGMGLSGETTDRLTPVSESRITSLPLSVGIGIHAAPTPGEFKLAIHIPDEAYREMVLPIVDLTQGEAQIQITGSVKPYIQTEGKPFYRQRQRPLQIGLSVSRSESLESGTLGCFVRQRTQTDVLMLSCNHVMAECNRGSIGDSICQPAIVDGGNAQIDQIALLKQFIPLKPCEQGITPVDAAIASVEQTAIADVTQLAHGKTLQGLLTLEELAQDLPLPVLKLGKQTGLTRGIMKDFGIRRLVPYGIDLTCDYSNLVAIEGIRDRSFSQPGDSGSLIYDAEGYAVALLIGGTDVGGDNNRGITYATPIDAVVHELEVELALS